jgi:hypothetical protein
VCSSSRYLGQGEVGELQVVVIRLRSRRKMFWTVPTWGGREELTSAGTQGSQLPHDGLRLELKVGDKSFMEPCPIST